MEPLTVAAIGGAVGGATSVFLQKALDSGGKWLNDYLKDYQPKAIEKAQTNVLAFLEILKRKIDKLEQKAEGAEEKVNRIRSAMEEPDFAALFKDAILGAARTENKTIHALLARLVSERLSSKDGDLISLAVGQACQLVRTLTGDQLRFLAVLTWVRYVLKDAIPQLQDYSDLRGILKDPRRCRNMLFLKTVRENLPLIVPNDVITKLDMLHLSGMSCVHIRGDTRDTLSNLNQLRRKIYEGLDLAPRNDRSNIEKACLNMAHLMGPAIGNDSGVTLAPIILTSTGLLIGLCVFDQLTSSETDLNRLFTELR